MQLDLRTLSLAIAFSLVGNALLADTEAKSPKQIYAEAMSFQAEAPERMIALLRDLANEGNARALDRLAFFTFKGVGTEQNVEMSVDLYRQAIAAGRKSSLVSLGKVYLATGAHQTALDTLDKASSAGQVKADAVLAWAHATGRLGALSDREAGFEALRTLAAKDIRDAQIYLLEASSRNKRTPNDIDELLDRLHARHTEGDAKAAESLLRFYRMQGHKRGTLEARAALLDTEGLRDKVRIEEALYLGAQQQPAAFWSVSEDLVQSAPPDVYARALSVAARINRNAYVRILQKELRAQGYEVGRASPYLNRPLRRAINRFCRDAGIEDECHMGPLKSVTIKAVARELAALRAVS